MPHLEQGFDHATIRLMCHHLDLDDSMIGQTKLKTYMCLFTTLYAHVHSKLYCMQNFTLSSCTLFFGEASLAEKLSAVFTNFIHDMLSM